MKKQSSQAEVVELCLMKERYLKGSQSDFSNPAPIPGPLKRFFIDINYPGSLEATFKEKNSWKLSLLNRPLVKQRSINRNNIFFLIFCYIIWLELGTWRKSMANLLGVVASVEANWTWNRTIRFSMRAGSNCLAAIIQPTSNALSPWWSLGAGKPTFISFALVQEREINGQKGEFYYWTP